MTADIDLLADAFELPPSALRLISREPLGDGSVAGFAVTHAADAESIAYVDTSGTPVNDETGLVLPGVARVWTHPADPHLPALVPTAFGDALAVLLARLGIQATERPEMVAYRPGRRAVLRVGTSDGASWIKVVLPRRVERIVDAHRTLSAGGLPIPAVRGWSPDGIIVLDAAAGTAATHVEWDPVALIDEVDALRARLARTETTRETRTRIPARLTWYVRQARTALPGERERVARIAAACEAGLAVDPGPRTPIHGDMHIGQLFLDGGGPDVRITGLIDVDTAGLGDPAEDAAAFVSHAVASALLTAEGSARDRMWALVGAARDRWTGPRVAAATAIHLLGHAVGAAMTGDGDRAERLLAFADDQT